MRAYHHATVNIAGSLWDMLGKYALTYVVVFETMNQLVEALETVALNNKRARDNDHSAIVHAMLGTEPPLDDAHVEHVRETLNMLVESIGQRMTFPSWVAQSQRITVALRLKKGPKELAQMVRELRTRLRDELSAAEFYYIPPPRLKFCKEPMLMGKDVNDRFPKAIDDIEDAGKCLALGQGTACVMHCMRIMECGLKALANGLGIPYAPSWESYLRQISTRIEAEHKKKTAKWKREQPFYRDLSGDLVSIKQAWRNPTMHIDRKYSPDEAEQIFAAVKNFMQRLAAHFTEKQMAKLLK